MEGSTMKWLPIAVAFCCVTMSAAAQTALSPAAPKEAPAAAQPSPITTPKKISESTAEEGAASPPPKTVPVARDEAKALEYLDCGRVAAVNMSIAAARGDHDTANGFRQMRTHFLLAATLKSGGDFVKKEIPGIIEKFDARHRDESKGLPLLRKETEQCSGTWLNEVRALVGFDKKS
jgi:hypothetical protein